MSGAIEIVAAPIGEAPLWVREAWIGLELPLLFGPEQGVWEGVGVLTGPHSWLGLIWARWQGRTKRVTGYCVSSVKAIDLLVAHRPDAADWWRRETRYGRDRGAVFLFDAPACRVIGDQTGFFSSLAR